MSPARLPQLGSVVWAELEDANGFQKVRPVVIITPTADLTAGKPGRVVAITTVLENALPAFASGDEHSSSDRWALRDGPETGCRGLRTGRMARSGCSSSPLRNVPDRVLGHSAPATRPQNPVRMRRSGTRSTWSPSTKVIGTLNRAAISTHRSDLEKDEAKPISARQERREARRENSG